MKVCKILPRKNMSKKLNNLDNIKETISLNLDEIKI